MSVQQARQFERASLAGKRVIWFWRSCSIITPTWVVCGAQCLASFGKFHLYTHTHTYKKVSMPNIHIHLMVFCAQQAADAKQIGLVHSARAQHRRAHIFLENTAWPFSSLMHKTHAYTYKHKTCILLTTKIIQLQFVPAYSIYAIRSCLPA